MEYTLDELVSAYDRLTAEITAAQAELELLQDQLRELVVNVIPNYVGSLGAASAIKLKDGRTLNVKQIVQLALPANKEENADRRAVALEYLRTHGASDLIKNVVVANVGRNEKATERLLHLIAELDLAAERREDVHHSTLSAWARERLESGGEAPTSDDGFNVYIGPKASIK